MKPFWLIISAAALIIILLLAFSDSAPNATTDKIANLGYYGIWGLAATSALLGSKIKLADAARNIAIWCVIIFALMCGYSLRYEIQDLAYRVTGGIIPGSPVTRYSENGKTVSLERSANGHFLTNAAVNGKTLSLTIDTGASAVVLTYDDAIAANIDVGRLGFNIPVETANGSTNAAPIIIDNLKIGDIERSNVRALVSRPGDLSGSLLGMSFLDRLTGYSVRGDRLILVD
ncbi:MULTISPECIES: TIGR02281 family clan AA aspartic protease [Bartonella]|uniref:TIGR02281 family clan AA aspartic protease n=1 Tax=Bartonella TaxID=773 RepID=UPI0018DC871B|nr:MULTISPECIES: TIGR02281 family clan AA aspartic protease [Bartonella]MBI0168991.1 TIGR02281 family clan AA aspartic protease [Bartonella sp. W8167]MBI0175021.1 TIGR02281 family clan AA aspartic protease [Bartonella apis]